MFDEPTNGGYSGGGIVAFSGGGPTVARPPSLDNAETSGDITSVTPDEIVVSGEREEEELPPKMLRGVRYAAPSKLGGFRSDLFGNLDLFNEAAPRQTKRAEELESLLERERSPEERAKRKKEDMYMALAQLGAKMASTPGTLLQAASAGIQEALPGAAAAAKERRGEERALTRELLAEERQMNKEVESRAGLAFEMLKNYNSLEQAFQNENFKNTLTRLGIDSGIVEAKIMAGASVRNALISAAAQRYVGGLGYDERRAATYQQIAADWDKSAALNPEYTGMLASDPEGAATYRNTEIMGILDRVMPTRGSSEGGGDDPLGMRGGR
jgi:hypothetical protein